jgi:hypothetical protein
MGNDLNTPAFSEVQGRYWYLTEVRKKSSTININRTQAPLNIYTIKFEAAYLIGRGAANLFSAVYTARQNHAFSVAKFGRICGDALYEMENFTEYDYFQHLQRANRWELHDTGLNLHTYDEDGGAVVLVFSWQESIQTG